MGDDLNDIDLLKVKLSACPSDAILDVKNNCNFISKYKGECGAF